MPVNFKVGDSYSIEKSFSFEEVKLFSELSLDKNPVHLDSDYAQSNVFKKPIVHGVLVGGLISAVIANYLPGPGSVYLHQSYDFKLPAYHDERLIATVTISDLKIDKNVFFLDTRVLNSRNEILVEGNAVIKLF